MPCKSVLKLPPHYSPSIALKTQKLDQDFGAILCH